MTTSSTAGDPRDHDFAAAGSAATVAVDFDPFAGEALARAVPTTEAQREIWFADQLSREASLSYNLATAIRLRGALSVDAMREAVAMLLARHDALRGRLSDDGTELSIAEVAPLAFELVDLSHRADQDAARVECFRRAVETPFDLRLGPLFRAELLKLADDEHVLVLSAHHIVCDGWSFGIITSELEALYAAAIGGSHAPLAAPESFADFALERATHDASEAERWWVAQFPDVPVLDLPTDRARPAMRGFASAREDRVLRGEWVADLRRLAAQRGASLFAALFAAYAVLLRRVSGEPDLVIGVPAAGQASRTHGPLVGHCVDLLPLRMQVDDVSFESMVDRAAGTVLDGFEHTGVTFGRLLQKLKVDRDPSRLPLVSVLFNLDTAFDARAFAQSLEAEAHTIARTHENFELFLNVVQHADALTLECQYDSTLFDGETIRRWLSAYEALLRDAVRDPATPVLRLSLLDDAARAELDALDPPATPFPADRLAHEWFELQASRTPGRVAVRAGDAEATYGALDARAERIADALRARGVGRGALVGIAVGRTLDLPASVLGVLKSGAGYVPLDPAYPAERLQFMASDARIAALVVDDEAPDGLANGAPLVRLASLSGADSAEGDSRGTAGLAAASGGEQAHTSQPQPSHAPRATPDSAAYVIYTSGSTGRPKGVVVHHAATANFIAAMQATPGLREDDVLCAVTTLSFDIAFFEMMLPLSVGATIVVASRDETRDGGALRALVERSGATFLQATPAGWRLLVESGWQGRPDFTAVTGGEPLAPDLAQALLARCGRVFNGYGPTETTVYSTMWAVGDPAQGIAIGRPVANTRISIRDSNGERVPRGVPGEMWIGGAGVATGYLDRDALTREKFVVEDGARWYRSGDRARWLADGNLQHLGRIDFQVKLRGYRIEPGEVEAAILEDAAIARAFATTREDVPGDVRWVAYVVAAEGGSIEVAGLRARLAARLPEFMVPQHVVVLDAMPLLPNGKIDRRALPAPATASPRAEAPVADLDALERDVLATMELVLAMPGLAPTDHFFDVGGHSLLAAQLATQLTRALDTTVPLRTIFEAPTALRLAAAIRAIRGEKDADATRVESYEIPRRADQSRAPLSALQQRLWFLEALYAHRTLHNTPSAHRLVGPLDLVAFERAWQALVERQAVLRTAIVAEGDGALQVVHDSIPFSLDPPEDLSSLPRDAREARLRSRFESVVDQPFDLSVAPLFRVKLFKLADDEHAMVFVVHHVIWDGWSFDLMYRELAALYAAFREQRAPDLAPLARSYVDFSAWQQAWLETPEAQRQLAHWTRALAGVDEPLDLPVDRARPPVMSGEGDTVALDLPPSVAEAARALGRRVDATLFMVLLAGYYAMLHRLTGQRDVIVGTPVRGRESAALEPIMGFFVNALPLRVAVDPSKSFAALVQDVRVALMDALSHPDVPFDRLVRALDVARDPSRSPLYQAFFSFQDARGRENRWHDLEHRRIELFQRAAPQDIALWFVEVAGGLTGGLTYNSDILERETVTRHARRFTEMLARAIEAPDTPIGRLALTTSDEAARIARWNDTRRRYDASLGYHGAFEARAAAEPQRLAVTFGDERASYGELDRRANQVAHAVVARGVRPGDRVGLMLDRSIDLVVALLGVLKAGATYVPIDPSFPPDRIAYMARDAKLALVLATSESIERVDVAARTLLLDRERAFVDRQPNESPAIAIDPARAAYVIYTSGSTGRPKGVAVPHRAVANFLSSMAEFPGLSRDDRLVAVTTLSFDIAVLELMLPLSVGATVAIASRDDTLDGRALADLLDRTDATVMQATPATWRVLLETGWTAPDGFKVLCGGEPLAADLALALRAQSREVYNLYGPTETTIWSTVWKVEHPDDGIRIGRPIANTTVEVLSYDGRGASGERCPIGVPGEIVIGGEGVALGYFERDALTAERFVPDRFSPTPGARAYRTGDRGRWRADGTLEHMGRLDFQVKVRGHRIEPGEIEAALSAEDDIAEVLVIAREDRAGDVRLVAYVTPRDGRGVDEASLRARARRTLPDYMVPQHVVALDAIPRLPNGKVDRHALPAPVAPEAMAFDRDRRAPQTATERLLAGTWAELLGVPDVGADDNFFDLGGHSLLAMQAIARIEQQTGKRLNPRRYIFETLEQVAASYDEIEAPAEPGMLKRMLGKWRGR